MPQTKDIGLEGAPVADSSAEKASANAPLRSPRFAVRSLNFDDPSAIARVGLLGSYVLIVVGFSVAVPNSFPTLANLQSTLALSAPLLLLAMVLTIPMIMGDFDLSFAATAQLAGAVTVYMLTKDSVGVAGGIAVALIVGLLVGLTNGLLVAWTGISAFILTLAVGSVAGGLELAVGGGGNLGLNIPQAYLNITRVTVFGFTLPVVIVLVVACVLWWVMRHTVFGRAAHALGGSPEAAYLAGVRVKLTRVSAFVIVGLGAGFAGVLLTSAAASYFANMATGLLLPAYAAVFIGAAVGARGDFNIFGTVFGVLFMATITAGLTMTNQPEWTTNVIFGVLLVAAVLMTKLGGLRRRSQELRDSAAIEEGA